MITLTEAAAKAVKEMLKKEKKESWGLRVGVAGGGCSGNRFGPYSASRAPASDLLRPLSEDASV